LDVLRGGTLTLKHTEFVILEVSILDYNSGSPQFREVIDFMAQAGFLIYDVINLIRLPTNNELCQMDMMFVRSGSAFRSTGILDRI
jgi:hypothetical protein